MGWDEIKAFQTTGITLNIIQEHCGRIKKRTRFPRSQIITLYTVLSHCTSLTIAFLYTVLSRCTSLTIAFLPACDISDFFCALRLWLRKV